MRNMKKHVVTINNMPPAKPMTCQVCHRPGPANEYHPHAFCVLHQNGIDPWQVVREAAAAAGWLAKADA